MNGTPNIILLCGKRRSGRSAMIRELLKRTRLSVSGYRTCTLNTRPDGYHEIYMFPYGEAHPQPTEESHIGDCNARQRLIHTGVFDTLGVELLNQHRGGILVMDELGFMETEADAFCSEVLKKLRGPGPILAAVRTSIETPFLRKVLSVENVLVVQMQPERFTEIYAQLSPIVAAWEQEAALC